MNSMTYEKYIQKIMKDKDKIKVRFSISLTKTYDEDDIDGFIDLSHLDYNGDIKTVLYSMIINDLSNAISDGKGHFEILG